MATRKAAKKQGAVEPAEVAKVDVSKDDNSAKTGRVSSTSTPRPKAPAVVGDAHDEPAPKATREKSEGRAPPADRGTRGRTRGIIRTPQRIGHGRGTSSPRSPKRRDRTPTRLLKRSADKPPSITFEEETESEVGKRSEAETGKGEVEEREAEERECEVEDEHSVSFVDEDTTLLERDFHEPRGDYYALDADTRRRGRAQGIPRDALLLEEWKACTAQLFFADLRGQEGGRAQLYRRPPPHV